MTQAVTKGHVTSRNVSITWPHSKHTDSEGQRLPSNMINRQLIGQAYIMFLSILSCHSSLESDEVSFGAAYPLSSGRHMQVAQARITLRSEVITGRPGYSPST